MKNNEALNATVLHEIKLHLRPNSTFQNDNCQTSVRDRTVTTKNTKLNNLSLNRREIQSTAETKAAEMIPELCPEFSDSNSVDVTDRVVTRGTVAPTIRDSGISGLREPENLELNSTQPKSELGNISATTLGPEGQLVSGEVSADLEDRATRVDDQTDAILACVEGANGNAVTSIVHLNVFAPKEGETSAGLDVYALLDTGASHSVISKNIFSKLGLTETGAGWITFLTVNNRSSQRHTTADIGIRKVTVSDYYSCIDGTVTVNKDCPIFIRTVILNSLPLSATMAAPEPKRVLIDIIIGQDFCWQLFKPEPFVTLDNGLTLLKTVLGDVYCGKLSNISLSASPMLCTSIGEFDEGDFWALERIGIDGNLEANAESKLNQKIRDNFAETVQIIDGDIFVRFPWKDNAPIICDNYNLAKRRLISTYNSLTKRGDDKLNAYHNEFVKQLERGVLELAPKKPDGKIKFYIPHQAVYKESDTTKLRVVLDASSHMKGELSLNDIVHPGPQLVPGLIGILLRCRLFKYLVISDIEKAFHAIKLQMSERDATRILWLKDITRPPTPDNILILRYTRVPFGVKSSPYLLGMSILFALKLCETPELVRELELAMYVDNIITGAMTEEEAYNKYVRFKKVFNSINMNLREFMTNTREIFEKIPPEDRMNDKTVVKLLGTLWNVSTDQLSVKVELNIVGPLTKRTILRAVAANFDPIGISLPLVIEAKVFYQALWKNKTNYKWDDEISIEEQRRWRKIENLYGSRSLITIPRFTDLTGSDSLTPHSTLHIFADASITSFAAVAYVQKVGNLPQIFFAKNRLHPTKVKGSVPRYELLALQCAINLTNFILTEIKINFQKINIYSDSTSALAWVKKGGDLQRGVFVENRVNFIRSALLDWQDNGQLFDLYHVPGEINPADLGTKGRTFEQLEPCGWFNGPKFLQKSPETWPKSIAIQDSYLVREGEDNMPHSLQLALLQERGQFENLFEIQRFGSFKKLIHVVALVNKAVTKWKSHKKPPDVVLVTKFDDIVIPLTVDDLREAEVTVLRQHQNTHALELRKQHKDFIVNKTGLLCRKDRLSETLEGEEKYPIMLSKSDPLTKLIITHFHDQNGHGGAAHTLAAVRRKFWIRHARSITKTVTQSCVTCQRLNGLPFRMPKFADLPKFRTGLCRPFERTGLDYFGPMKIKSETENEKSVWALICTCLVTRNIYLQLVTSLNTTTFLNALKIFSSRRGAPKEILCDNALSFKLASKYTYRTRPDEDSEDENELSPEEVDKRNLTNTLANYGIAWKFTVPHAPWEGGLYERLIGNVKRTLGKISKSRDLTYQKLETLLAEVEGFVNSRPLTYVSEDHADQVIRPVDFITPHLKLNLQVLTEDEICGNEAYKPHIPQTHLEVEKAIKKLNKHLDNVWKCFKRGYVQSLRERSNTNFKGRTTVKEPKVGGLVMIIENDLKRGQYQLGKITEIHLSADGHARSATVKTGAKSSLRRPLNLLIPLEIAQ